MELSAEIIEKIGLLSDKYEASGQNLSAYLDGLLYAEYLTYWDYINLDVLLNLQQPKTAFEDEKIFIVYHQITELYFNLILHELEQIVNLQINSFSLLARIKRINSYFDSLVNSFTIMIDGMDPKEFLKFRMSLLPASGFQSFQYRAIEIFATDFYQLIDKEVRDLTWKNKSIEAQYQHIYWKKGATELATGKKTLTLLQFEKKYSERLIKLAKERVNNNLWTVFTALPQDENTPLIQAQLRLLDVFVNVNWPLAHYKSAVRYLHKKPEDIAATGGTNWQKYLPPRFQKRIFYPELWTVEEIEQWGKGWVDDTLAAL